MEKGSLERSSHCRDPKPLSEPCESSERIHTYIFTPLFLVAMDTVGMLWRNGRVFSLSCSPSPVQRDIFRKDQQQHYQQGENNRIDLCPGGRRVYCRNSRNQLCVRAISVWEKQDSDSSPPPLECVASCMVGPPRATTYLSVPVCW